MMRFYMVNYNIPMRADVLEDLDRLYAHVQKRSDGPSSKDVVHVEERDDGSSDGLPEDLKIHQYNEDGSYEYSECLGRNPDLHQEWSLEELYHKNNELTAEQLFEVFNIFDEMWILKKREPILNKLTQKDLKKLHELYKIYKSDNVANK